MLKMPKNPTETNGASQNSEKTAVQMQTNEKKKDRNEKWKLNAMMITIDRRHLPPAGGWLLNVIIS